MSRKNLLQPSTSSRHHERWQRPLLQPPPMRLLVCPCILSCRQTAPRRDRLVQARARWCAQRWCREPAELLTRPSVGSPVMTAVLAWSSSRSALFTRSTVVFFDAAGTTKSLVLPATIPPLPEQPLEPWCRSDYDLNRCVHRTH